MCSPPDGRSSYLRHRDDAPEGVRRLGRVAKICESYGNRAQKSVFECRLSETRVQQLLVELGDEIDFHADSINLYRFLGSIPDSRMRLGRDRPHELGEPWIL